MAMPHYADDLVTLHLGDCIGVMAAMPDASVDAVVTDPPYGLAELSAALVLKAIAAWMAGDRAHVPDGRGFMGREWDRFVPPPGVWDECMRVLKPGGHLLAFAGSRTVDLMTLSIRIAGFEIRDSLHWMYGSGFPKSLDVSKAIDKAANAVLLWDDIRAHIRIWRDRAGMTNAQLNAALGLATNGAGMARHWTSEVGGQHSIPSKAMWLRLKDLLGWPDCELDAVYGEVKDGADRPVITLRHVADRRGDGTVIGLGHAGNADVTIPATEDAACWEGWGTALKPAHEPIVVARKPLTGTVAANVLAYGTGALNVDGCRVTLNGDYKSKANGRPSLTGLGDNYDPAQANQPDTEGRWPPNILLTHPADCQPAGTRRVRTGTHGSAPGGFNPNGTAATYGRGNPETDVSGGYADADGMETVRAWDCAPGCPVAGLDAQSGVSGEKSRTLNRNGARQMDGWGLAAPSQGIVHGDSGGASRFFPVLNWDAETDLPFLYCAKAPKSERPTAPGISAHPTVKPLAVMRWLVRLVTPPGGLVLDPFAGTGTTGQASALEGFRCIMAERDPDSAELARVRLSKPVQQQMALDLPA